MAIKRFEDIRAWQEARALNQGLYEVVSQGSFARDYKLRDQILSAAASIMANIAEGFDAQSDAEFIKFLGYARRSASEVQSHLYLALDRKHLTRGEFEGLYAQAVEVKRLIGGFIRYLRKGGKGQAT